MLHDVSRKTKKRRQARRERQSAKAAEDERLRALPYENLGIPFERRTLVFRSGSVVFAFPRNWAEVPHAPDGGAITPDEARARLYERAMRGRRR